MFNEQNLVKPNKQMNKLCICIISFNIIFLKMQRKTKREKCKCQNYIFHCIYAHSSLIGSCNIVSFLASQNNLAYQLPGSQKYFSTSINSFFCNVLTFFLIFLRLEWTKEALQSLYLFHDSSLKSKYSIFQSQH